MTKKLAPSVASPIFSAGDDVPFVIEVFNQGIIDATNVRVIDDIPVDATCFDVDLSKNPDWVRPVPGGAYYILDNLAAGDSFEIPLIMTIKS